MPKAMIRAGKSRTTRGRRSAFTGAGGEGMLPELTAGANTRRWARAWSPWMTRIGRSRRRCTAFRCRGSTLSSRSGPESAFAAATASWIARFIPTPPTGDIAWAASPMHKRPGRYQRFRRFTWTDRSFTCSQSSISPVRSATSGTASPMDRRNDSRPAARTCRSAPLGKHVADLPVVAAVYEDEEPAPADVAGGLLGVACSAREPEPEHVYGRGGPDHL